jgi:uncharacterized protein (TIGR03435 family)
MTKRNAAHKSVVVAVVAFAVGACWPAAPRATQATNPLRFEVATVKVSTTPVPPGPASPDRYTRFYISLRDLIGEAYGVQPFQVIGGPDWINGSVRFDVAAKASSAPSRADLRAMLASLLVDRFSLNAQIEVRELPVFLLQVARGDGRLGNQLIRTTDDCAAIRAAWGATPPRPAVNGRPVCTSFQRARQDREGVSLRYQSGGMTTQDLAAWISPYVQRPVVDRTGLQGEFDVDLSFSPGVTTASTPGAPVQIYTAIEDQLGLKLESGRAPVDAVVVLKANMPTPD